MSELYDRVEILCSCGHSTVADLGQPEPAGWLRGAGSHPLAAFAAAGTYATAYRCPHCVPIPTEIKLPRGSTVYRLEDCEGDDGPVVKGTEVLADDLLVLAHESPGGWTYESRGVRYFWAWQASSPEALPPDDGQAARDTRERNADRYQEMEERGDR